MVDGTVETVDSDDGFAEVWGGTRRRHGRAIIQGLVRSLLVIVPIPDRDGFAHGIFPEEDELAENEILEGLDESLDVAILPGLTA